jgi:hypothetical protein
VGSTNDTRAGNGTTAHRPIIERLMTGTELRVSDRASSDGEPAVICETHGAMSEQSNDAAHGHQSMPQKLVQLVGCRDPNAAAADWHRPRRN